MSSVLLRLKKTAIVITGGVCIDPFRPCVVPRSSSIDQLVAQDAVEILHDNPGITDTEWAKIYLAAGKDLEAALKQLPAAEGTPIAEAKPAVAKKASKKE